MTALFGLDGGNARENASPPCGRSAHGGRMEALNRYTGANSAPSFEIEIGLHFGRMIVGRWAIPQGADGRHRRGAGRGPPRPSRQSRKISTVILATEDLINVVEEDVQVGRVLQQSADKGRERCSDEIVDFRKPDAVLIVQSSFETVHRRRKKPPAVLPAPLRGRSRHPAALLQHRHEDAGEHAR